jgi:hypothetical protein
MVNTILNMRTKRAKVKVKKLNLQGCQGSEITISQQIANVFDDNFCSVG